MKVAIVIGTRPEILKVTPIIRELRKQKINYRLYYTNQHHSSSMSDAFFKEFGIYPHDSLPVAYTIDRVLNWLAVKFEEYNPSVVLVQGDTNSTLYGAMAAMDKKIPIAHVEAGLRSFDFKQPFPEEYNRVLVDSISKFLFAPTWLASENLRGMRHYIVGNTIIDLVKKDVPEQTKLKQVLITCHRRENWGKIEEISTAIKGVREMMSDYEFIFVKHANKKISDEFEKNLKDFDITFVEPQPYLKFMKLLAQSELIISDSGGVVEEASYFRVPVAILRNKTERMESIHAGIAILVGTRKDMWRRIISFMERYYKEPIYDKPYGTGNSAQKIVEILKGELQ